MPDEPHPLLCSTYGYDLRATDPAASCPECGLPVSISIDANVPPARRSLVSQITLWLCGLGAVATLIGTIKIGIFEDASGFKDWNVLLLLAGYFEGPWALIAASALTVRYRTRLALLTLVVTLLIGFLGVMAAHELVFGRDAQSGLVLIFGPFWQWVLAGLLFVVAMVCLRMPPHRIEGMGDQRPYRASNSTMRG